MNSTASEEIVSATEVPEVSQITVGTDTSTSSTSTQSVAGTRTNYVPLFTSYTPQALPSYSYQSSGYQQSFAAYQECPINFNRPDYTTPTTKVQEVYNIHCMNDHANHVA